MPVFHTKTIQMILEPVANQVSQLVILHEQAECGNNPIPDLSEPIYGVSRAVDNLVMVGRETTAASKDKVLQQEMPLALDRVSEASSLLIETSRLLKQDPYSADARRKLIDGSRGILQGTSTLLLVSDQAEVRKILRTCKAVYECLAIAEVIETLDDLIVYVKNMTPGLTQMTREVENRRSDLVHRIHSDLLQKALDKVKAYTPIVISAIKTYVSTLQTGQGRAEAVENRNYVISKVMEAIQEIMRVLQLTSYDEDEWESDELTIIKRLKYQLDENRSATFDWLNNPNADSGALGQVLLRQSLDDAEKMAERCQDPAERKRLLANIRDMDNMLKTLCDLRRANMGHTPQAMKLAESLGSAFDHLLHDVSRTVDNLERTSAGRPAHTVLGKVEQAQRWLNNPYARDGDSGEQAIRMVIAEGRRIAEVTPNQQLKGHLYRICDDVEMLTNRLSDLRQSGHAESPESRAIAHDLSRKLDALKAMIQDGVIWQVADCFADTMTPIRLLHQAAMNPPGTPNRDQIFQERALNYIDHANTIIAVSRKVASTCVNNKQYSEDISALAGQLQDGTPQIVHSAKIVLTYPGDQAVMEHFELLKKEWTSTLEQLCGLVDEVIDTGTFIKASEAGMIHHAERAEHALSQYNIPEFSNNTSQIVRRADRVARVADGDAASSDDPHFVERVGAAVKLLRTQLSPVVLSAKDAAMNPQEKTAVSRWKTSNQALITAVGKVHHAILIVPDYNKAQYAEDLHSPHPPDMSQLSINTAADYDSLARHLKSALGGTSRQHQQPSLSPAPPIPPHPRNLLSPYSSSDENPSWTQTYARSEVTLSPVVNRRDLGSVTVEIPINVNNAELGQSDQRAGKRRHLIGGDSYSSGQSGDEMHRDHYDGNHSGSDSMHQEKLSPAHSRPGQSQQRGRQQQQQQQQPHHKHQLTSQELYARELVSESHQANAALPSHTTGQPSHQTGHPSHQTGHPSPTTGYPSQYFRYDRDQGPPRPPLPADGGAPPRPPPPAETDDEDESFTFPAPQANQPIMMAAHELHLEAKQWSSKDNELIAAAKRMAKLMARLSQLVRGESGNKIELIDTAKRIALASDEVAMLATKLAKEITDRRMRNALLQVCERIPTIGTQLKVLTTVKATMLGAQEEIMLSADGSEINCESSSEEDQEATEMLVGNAQNLMQSVRETVRAAEAASIKMRVDSGYSLRWLRKRPWYT